MAINFSLNNTIASTALSPAANIAAAGLIQNTLKELITATVFIELPTPDERYLVARKNLERFSITGAWTSLDFVTSTSVTLGGWGFTATNSAAYLPFISNPIYKRIDTNSKNPVYSFPLHLNLHLINIIYYNSLASDFFKSLIDLDSNVETNALAVTKATSALDVANNTLTIKKAELTSLNNAVVNMTGLSTNAASAASTALQTFSAAGAELTRLEGLKTGAHLTYSNLNSSIS